MTHFNPICLIYVHIDTSEHVWLVKLYFITGFMSPSLKMLRKSIMVWARSSVCIPARSKMLCCPSLKKEADMYFLSHARMWSGGAMVLGKLPVPGRPAYLE